jgi:TetR/AcrR family transcriptional regulator, ethionamide resistance regulator
VSIAAEAAATGRRRGGPSKGDLKEAAILDTCWRLLSEKPMTAITVEELAAGAGISRSSFYFYFDSRDAVVRALATRTSGELGDAVLGAVQANVGAHEAINAIVARLLSRWRADGPVMRAMDTLAQDDPELRNFWSTVTEAVVIESAAGIERQRAAGLALPGPPSALDLVWALTHMYWRAGQQASLGPVSAADDERLVETLTIVTMRALYGTG